MFGITALLARKAAQDRMASSSVTSAMDGLSRNLPSAGGLSSAGSAPQSGIAGSAPQSGIAGSAQEGMIASVARRAQKQVGMHPPQASIPMSESYNSASSRPVFNDKVQSRAKSIFGDNNQRQASVNGCCEK
jgi:hypothetical protein